MAQETSQQVEEVKKKVYVCRVGYGSYDIEIAEVDRETPKMYFVDRKSVVEYPTGRKAIFYADKVAKGSAVHETLQDALLHVWGVLKKNKTDLEKRLVEVQGRIARVEKEIVEANGIVPSWSKDRENE